MPNVDFKYDIFKDGTNIQRVLLSLPAFDKSNLSRTTKGLPEELIKQISIEKDLLGKQIIIVKWLAEFLDKNRDFLNKKVETFSNEWNRINKTFFIRLEEILDIKIPENNSYSCFLTFAGSCPFNIMEGWFMVRIADETIINTAAHEIMHIEFQRAYGLYLRNLGLASKKCDDLRESLTILLNKKMADILPRPDFGYEEHQSFRKKIVELWEEKESIKYIIDKMVNVL